MKSKTLYLDSNNSNNEQHTITISFFGRDLALCANSFVESEPPDLDALQPEQLKSLFKKNPSESFSCISGINH